MRQARVTASTAIALWLMLPFWATHASAVEEVARLSPSDAELGLGEGFGASVAISGDWIVVGAPKDDHFGYDAGAAYVFRRVGPKWIEQDKLLGFPLVNGRFGTSVAIDGDWIVVGAPGGLAVHVHHRDDRGTPEDFSDDLWLRAALLHPPPSQWCCGFAWSVDIDGDLIVVGTIVNEFRVGRAYVFRWDGSEWLPDATLVGADTEAGDSFGKSVAVSGELVVVGAVKVNDRGVRSGVVYSFRRRGGTWVQKDKLDASALGNEEILGSSISLSSDSLAIGAAYRRDQEPFLFGAVYIFRYERQRWVQETRIAPSEVSPFDVFGGSVALDSNLVVIGAAASPWGHVFRRHHPEWIRLDTLIGADPITFPPIAIAGNFAVVWTYVYAVRNRMSLRDFAELQNCLVPGDPVPECDRFELTRDGEINLADYGEFLATFTGP